MSKKYTSFRIDFYPRDGEIYTVSASSAAGERTGTLHTPSDDPAF